MGGDYTETVTRCERVTGKNSQAEQLAVGVCVDLD